MSPRLLQIENHLAPDQGKLTGAMGGTISIALELMILQRIKLDCIRRTPTVGEPLFRHTLEGPLLDRHIGWSEKPRQELDQRIRRTWK